MNQQTNKTPQVETSNENENLAPILDRMLADFREVARKNFIIDPKKFARQWLDSAQISVKSKARLFVAIVLLVSTLLFNSDRDAGTKKSISSILPTTTGEVLGQEVYRKIIENVYAALNANPISDSELIEILKKEYLDKNKLILSFGETHLERDEVYFKLKMQLIQFFMNLDPEKISIIDERFDWSQSNDVCGIFFIHDQDLLTRPGNDKFECPEKSYDLGNGVYYYPVNPTEVYEIADMIRDFEGIVITNTGSAHVNRELLKSSFWGSDGFDFQSFADVKDNQIDTQIISFDPVEYIKDEMKFNLGLLDKLRQSSQLQDLDSKLSGLTALANSYLTLNPKNGFYPMTINGQAVFLYINPQYLPDDDAYNIEATFKAYKHLVENKLVPSYYQLIDVLPITKFSEEDNFSYSAFYKDGYTFIFKTIDGKSLVFNFDPEGNLIYQGIDFVHVVNQLQP